MTMAEENVFCCTSTRLLNTDHLQRLQFQARIPQILEPLVSKLKTPILRTVTTSTPKFDLPHQRHSLIRSVTRINDLKPMIMDHEIDSRNLMKISTRPIPQSHVRFSQTAINTESFRTKKDSNPPIINIQGDHPVKQSHRISWPIVTQDTVNPLRFIISNLQDLFRRDMDTQIQDWCHLQMNTPTQVSWLQPQEIHSHQIHSHHHHLQHQRTIVSCHHHHSRLVQAKNILRLRVWLVILLLIGFCPPVLRVPGIVSVQRQLHRFLQERIDFPHQNDFWFHRHQFMTQKINNVTRHHPLNNYLHHQFWVTYKVTDAYMPLVKIRPHPNLEFHQKDWYPPLLFMHQYQKDLQESLLIDIWSNRQYTNVIKLHRVIAIDLLQYHQSQKDFCRVLQIQRVHIKDILRAREFCHVLVHLISLEGIPVRKGAVMVPVRNTAKDRVHLQYPQILLVDLLDFKMLDRDLSSQMRDSVTYQCNDMDSPGLLTDIWRLNDTWRLILLHTMAKWSAIRIGE